MPALMCTRKNLLVVAVFSIGSEETLRRRLAERDKVDLMVEINNAARVFFQANVDSLAYLYGAHRDVPCLDEMFPCHIMTPNTNDAGRRLLGDGKRLLREVHETLELPLATRLKACSFFHYQACEPRDYTAQPWFAKYARALANLTQSVPGWSTAPWGI